MNRYWLYYWNGHHFITGVHVSIDKETCFAMQVLQLFCNCVTYIELSHFLDSKIHSVSLVCWLHFEFLLLFNVSVDSIPLFDHTQWIGVGWCIYFVYSFQYQDFHSRPDQVNFTLYYCCFFFTIDSIHMSVSYKMHRSQMMHLFSLLFSVSGLLYQVNLFY